MYDFFSLTKRNILVFIRDKTALFFSFLSVIILLALYFLFLGKLYTAGLPDLTDNLKTYLSTSQMMGGILVINTLSLSLGMMGNIVVDLETHRLDAFLVTPIKRPKIILSYYLSSIIVTAILTLLIWFATILYVGLTSGYWYSLLVIVSTTGLLVVYTFISASLMILITSFLKSNNAFGTVAGVLGTFVGFVAGIYMPLANFGKGMQYFSSILPFTHMTILLKQILLKEPFQLLEIELGKNIPAEDVTKIMEDIRTAYGTIEIGIFETSVSIVYILIAAGLLSLILLWLAFKNMVKKMKS
ncbi:MAG: ABC transporter permease [Acholeplasmataceae bacterium]